MGERTKVTTKTPETNKNDSVSQAKNTNSYHSINSTIGQLLFLQRTVGNQAVERLLKSRVIQAKLTIGQPGDIYEQEADRIAGQVMRMPDLSKAQRNGDSKHNQFPSIQRMCTDCEQESHRQTQNSELGRLELGHSSQEELQRQPMEEDEELLQMKEVAGGVPEVSSETESQINDIRGSGQPLPESVRAFFETRFNRNFSQVRVHTDEKAAKSARSVRAEAYTVGHDIVFGTDQYLPETCKGKRLLAHELTHTIQQQGTVNAPDRHSVLQRRDDNEPNDQISLKEEDNKAELEFHSALHFNRTFSGFNPTGEPKEGEYAIIWWRVWNTGWKTAPEHTNRLTIYKADLCSGCRYEKDEIFRSQMPAPSIVSITQQGKDEYESAVVIPALSAGHYDAYVELDVRNEVEEINEDNNSAFMVFVVRPSNESESAIEGEEETIRTKKDAGRAPDVGPDVESQISALRGGCQPLPQSLRAFFEPRFGYDLSHVRIHTDRSAASTSQSLQAAAFTFGSDIFFNTGQFSPDTATGFGLMAHELAHVAQQRAGSVSRRLIQRAELPYHQLKWEDFKAQAPTTAPESAGLWSSFKIPTPDLTSSTIDTKKTCKLDKPIGRRTKDTRFEGKGSVDPTQFDNKFQPYMDTDKSWLQERFKDNAYCNSVATQCESDFDQNKNVRPKLGNAVANKKSDCKSSFLRTCLADQKTKMDLLLKHEQGHFDITKVMADKARDDVKAKAATLKFSAGGCGHDAAMDAVRQLFKQPSQELLQLGEAWITFKEKVQDAYDLETTRGSIQAKQTAWEAKIKAGLKDYVLPAAPQPAPAPATPTQSPATPAPTKTPATPAPAPKK
jgi:hypothetical protein